MAADLILTNGIVYTVDAARSRHEAVAVADGRIVAVGTAAEVGELAGPRTRVVDLGGRLLLPGFIDAHMHASSATEDLFDVSLADCTLGRGVRRPPWRASRPSIRSCPFIRGFGWSDTYTPRLGPAAADLDAVVADRPVLLNDDSYHSAWLNSAGLRLAGIDARTPDPANGVIERLADGTPSGTLREGPGYVAALAFPTYTPDQSRQGILHFQRDGRRPSRPDDRAGRRAASRAATRRSRPTSRCRRTAS